MFSILARLEIVKVVPLSQKVQRSSKVWVQNSRRKNFANIVNGAASMQSKQEQTLNKKSARLKSGMGSRLSSFRPIKMAERAGVTVEET
jgi:hypothetical protein